MIDQPAAGREQLDVPGQVGGAHDVEHDVHAAAAGLLPGPGDEVLARGSRSRRPRRARRQRSRFAAEPAVHSTRAPSRFATWIACVPMPEAPPCTRNVSPSRRCAELADVGPDRAGDLRQRGGLHQRQPGRDRQQLAGRDGDPLGVPAAAEQRAHLVADLPAGDAVAERGRPGRCTPGPGTAGRRAAAGSGPAAACRSARLTALAATSTSTSPARRLRVGHLRPVQHLGTARLADRDRVHRPTLGGLTAVRHSSEYCSLVRSPPYSTGEDRLCAQSPVRGVVTPIGLSGRHAARVLRGQPPGRACSRWPRSTSGWRPGLRGERDVSGGGHRRPARRRAPGRARSTCRSGPGPGRSPAPTWPGQRRAGTADGRDLGRDRRRLLLLAGVAGIGMFHGGGLPSGGGPAGPATPPAGGCRASPAAAAPLGHRRTTASARLTRPACPGVRVAERAARPRPPDRSGPPDRLRSRVLVGRACRPDDLRASPPDRAARPTPLRIHPAARRLGPRSVSGPGAADHLGAAGHGSAGHRPRSSPAARPGRRADGGADSGTPE